MQLLWHERRPAAGVLFAATLMALITVETLAFNQLSGGELAFGRIEALSKGHHVEWMLGKTEPMQFYQLTTRWLRIPAYDGILSLGFAGCLAWVLLQKKARSEAPDFVICVLLTGICYALAITFAIAGFNPIRPAVPLRPMYLEAFFPFAIIGSVWLYASWSSHIQPGLRTKLEFGGGLAMLVMLAAFISTKGPLTATINNGG